MTPHITATGKNMINKKLKQILYLTAIVSTITSIILYFCGFQRLSGYLMPIVAPTCVISIIIEKHEKNQT